jgi:hypothetical protein
MKQVQIDPAAFRKAGVSYTRDGEVAVIRIGKPDIQVARIRVIGDQLQFFPERSAAHKAVLLALDIPAE